MPFIRLPCPGFVPPALFAWRAAVCHGQPVSGDALFLETGRRDDPCWMVLLIDATGKGPMAAEVVDHLADLLLHYQTAEELQPAELLHHLHGQLAPVSDVLDRYAEAIALLFDPVNRTVRAATAGAIRPWRAPRPWNDWGQWDLPSPGTWIGLGDPVAVLPGEGEFIGEPAMRVLTFTDGVADGVLLAGQGPFKAFLDALPPAADPEALLDGLFEALRQCDPADWPGDDTTACCWQVGEIR